MNTNIFVVYILSMTCALSFFYAELREYYTPIEQYKEKATRLEGKVQEERVKHLLTSYEFQEFRAYVGTVLPKAIQEVGPGEKSYPLRTLASVVQKQSSETLAVARANAIFENGKNLFRNKKYESAVEKFNKVIADHPYSAYVPEALFLLVESQFVLRNYDQCIHAINKMIDLYPESELTGYAMLRLGKVYELQDRHDEAIDIYKTVLISFPDRGIASVANSNLRAVEL